MKISYFKRILEIIDEKKSLFSYKSSLELKKIYIRMVQNYYGSEYIKILEFGFSTTIIVP
jgi:hypothetical protein